MSKFSRRVYDVALNPESFDPLTSDPFDETGVTVHRVTVIHADQMLGEREAMRRGITTEQPQNMTSVIVWCAMRRAGLFTGTYEEFRDARLLDIGNPDRPGEGQEVTAAGSVVEDVPPTVGRSDSASSWPGSSPVPLSGSTPTSTNT